MPDFELESAHAGPVAGVDEAGRGPLAGPVIAAAVIFDRKRRLPPSLDRLNDSKLLKANVRAQLFRALHSAAERGIAWFAIGLAEVREIDRLNILEATKLAMSRAIAALPQPPACALIDGNQPPALPCTVEPVIGGDGKSLSIAAASIIAKVTRDRLMQALARFHPGYGWHRNAGYGTPEHLAGLDLLGPSPHHRTSFAPVSAARATSPDCESSRSPQPQAGPQAPATRLTLT